MPFHLEKVEPKETNQTHNGQSAKNGMHVHLRVHVREKFLTRGTLHDCNQLARPSSNPMMLYKALQMAGLPIIERE